ncbi:MAG TPA: 30S ribosomal protein S4, partial [Victivallales bacterium]|nr:30S ribosomal protein S4 [Victivallales bacterium]
VRAKHKLCRRIGACIWGSPKCPSAKRPYKAGPHGKTSQKKLSTYGELLLEKQKLKMFYALTERQLRLAYMDAKRSKIQTDFKFLRNLELKLASVVYRGGLAPTIFAAKQYVSHRHILVDGRIVDRPSYMVKPGQIISINPERDPALASKVKDINCEVPAYLQLDKDNCKLTVVRDPVPGEIPCNIEVMRVVEFYAK